MKVSFLLLISAWGKRLLSQSSSLANSKDLSLGVCDFFGFISLGIFAMFLSLHCILLFCSSKNQYENHTNRTTVEMPPPWYMFHLMAVSERERPGQKCHEKLVWPWPSFHPEIFWCISGKDLIRIRLGSRNCKNFFYKTSSAYKMIHCEALFTYL